MDSKIQKKIDVISATVTNLSDQDDDHNNNNNNNNKKKNNSSSKLAPTRIFLNAAEIGVGAEIIDRSKKIRERSKVVLYQQFQVL